MYKSKPYTFIDKKFPDINNHPTCCVKTFASKCGKPAFSVSEFVGITDPENPFGVNKDLVGQPFYLCTQHAKEMHFINSQAWQLVGVYIGGRWEDVKTW